MPNDPENLIPVPLLPAEILLLARCLHTEAGDLEVIGNYSDAETVRTRARHLAAMATILTWPSPERLT